MLTGFIFESSLLETVTSHVFSSDGSSYFSLFGQHIASCLSSFNGSSEYLFDTVEFDSLDLK